MAGWAARSRRWKGRGTVSSGRGDERTHVVCAEREEAPAAGGSPKPAPAASASAASTGKLDSATRWDSGAEGLQASAAATSMPGSTLPIGGVGVAASTAKSSRGASLGIGFRGGDGPCACTAGVALLNHGMPTSALRTALAAFALALPPAFTASLPAQTLADLTATPESTAVLFLRSVRAIRWGAAAQFMHPATLARLRDVVGYMVDTDSTGALRRTYTGADDRTAFLALEPATVFERAVGRMVDDMPGLMHSLFDHDDDVIGHVAEGADTAHVVYRTIERLQGAQPEVRVIQMAHAPGGWRVLWSDELEVLEAALRGIPRSRRAPPPASGTPGLTSPPRPGAAPPA